MDFHTYLRTKLAPRTVALYDQQIRRLERWCYNYRIIPDEITHTDLVAWADTIPCTFASRKAARQALRYWEVWLERTDSPHEAIYVPRKPTYRCRALDGSALAELRDTAALHGGRQGLATLCALYLGARRAEIATLTWGGYSDGRMRWDRVKDGPPGDEKVHPVLAGALDEARWQASSMYVFPGDRGRPHISPTTIWEWIRHVGRIAGVQVTPHELRHSALATANDSTGDLRATMEFAGHRNPATTAIYTRTMQARRDAAVDALDY